jgi:acyl-CoA thioesterase FadM
MSGSASPGATPPVSATRIGRFADDDDAIAAQGHFVHVHVNRAADNPVPIPDRTRRVLQGLVLPAPSA